MKCRECGCKQYSTHKMSCSTVRWGRTPMWVTDSSWDNVINADSSNDWGSDSSGNDCE